MNRIWTSGNAALATVSGENVPGIGPEGLGHLNYREPLANRSAK
jgi:hypothetical protein